MLHCISAVILASLFGTLTNNTHDQGCAGRSEAWPMLSCMRRACSIDLSLKSGHPFSLSIDLHLGVHSLTFAKHSPSLSPPLQPRKMTTPMSSLDSQTAGGLIPPLTLAGTSTPLAHQVAGHQNVRADASGSLVIKVPSQLSWLCH